MEVVISPEFLMSPAFSDEESLYSTINDLVRVSVIAGSNDYGINFIKPDLLIDRLIELELYPSEKLFRNNFEKCELDECYSSRDIVTMIHKIIDKCQDISDSSDVFDVEYNLCDVTIKPNDISLKINLCPNLFWYDLTLTSIINCKESRNLKVILGKGNSNNNIYLKHSEVTLYSIISGVETLNDVESNVSVVNSFDSLLLNIGSQQLWEQAINANILFLAIITRVLELNLASGKNIDECLGFDSFSIGDRFIESLAVNQCHPHSKFGLCCFEAICRVICREPKYELKKFRENDKSGSNQRKKGTAGAYRTHVTKGGEGIRLMFWEDSFGKIELANVGNKSDLEIF